MDDIERHLADCSMDSSSRSMDDADVIILVNQALSDVHHLDLDADIAELDDEELYFERTESNEDRYVVGSEHQDL